MLPLDECCRQAFYLSLKFHYQSIKTRTHIYVTKFHILFWHTRTQSDVLLRRFGADVEVFVRGEGFARSNRGWGGT
jgi:hypothetical protein